MRFEGIEVAAEGLRVGALLEDREAIAAGGDKAVGRDGGGHATVYGCAVRGVTLMILCPAGFVGLYENFGPLTWNGP